MSTIYCKSANCQYNKNGLYCEKLTIFINEARSCIESLFEYKNSEYVKQEMQNGFRCEDTKDDCRTGEIEENIIGSNETESEEKSGRDVEQE